MATDFSRMTVVELRQELKRRNLPQTGKKADLIDRLETTSGDETDPEPRENEVNENDISVDENQNAQDLVPSQSTAEPQPEGAPDLAPQEQPAVDSRTSSPPQGAPQAPIDNSDSAPTAVANESSEPARDLAPAEKSAEPEAVPAAEIITDAVSRKRRSRSPPPENESARKRARPTDPAAEVNISAPRDTSLPSGTEQIPSQLTGQDSPEGLQPEAAQQTITNSDAATRETVQPDQQEQYEAAQHGDSHHARDLTPPRYQADTMDEPMPDYDRDVAPALHSATSALYIKNFMRPLREPVLRDYLVELAALPGAAPDPDCLVDFHLDQIRTHAFASFTSVSAASRVRSALHGIVWPNERNRKELWADFVPEDKVAEWIDREQSEGGRGASGRWEVHYEPDDNGTITAALVNAELEPPRRNSTRQQPPAPPPVPTGPARNFPGVEGAPLGPRGRGTNHYRQAPPPQAAPAAGDHGRDYGRDSDHKTTRAHPPLHYRPVSEDVAAFRLDNMNAYITKDRRRDLGRPDEINRYTFENGSEFVDRGKEAFIGIRPPHRERERRRLGIGRGGGPGGGNRGPPPRRRSQSPRRLSRDDDGYRGGGGGGGGGGYRDRDDGRRDDWGRDRFRDDVPRSRFDGQPLPTFGGGRGGRRGGGFGGEGGFGGGGGGRRF